MPNRQRPIRFQGCNTEPTPPPLRDGAVFHFAFALKSEI